MEFSWIQRHVLLVLIRKPTARSKDLVPPDIPANQFSYHLEGLIACGLVSKISRGVYALTPAGERTVGMFSTKLNKQVEAIKTVVLFYGQRDDENLLYRWNRQPYFGCITPPYGHMSRGRSLTDGVNQILEEKLGVVQPVEYKTSALIKIIHKDEIISHMNALIYEVRLDKSNLPKMTRNGEAFVGALDEQDKVMGGVQEFLDVIDTSTEPFESEWRY